MTLIAVDVAGLPLGQWLASATITFGVVVTLVLLLRRRKLREKYVALWLTVGAGMVILTAWPPLLLWTASALGIVAPTNLLFLAGIALLLGVCIHLSVECSTLEDETRILAEEIALLRNDLHRLNVPPSMPGQGEKAGTPDGDGGE